VGLNTRTNLCGFPSFNSPILAFKSYSLDSRAAPPTAAEFQADERCLDGDTFPRFWQPDSVFADLPIVTFLCDMLLEVQGCKPDLGPYLFRAG